MPFKKIRFPQVPYCGSLVLEELPEVGLWQLIEPPYPSLIHAPNPRFDWKLLQGWDAHFCLYTPTTVSLSVQYQCCSHSSNSDRAKPGSRNNRLRLLLLRCFFGSVTL